MPTDHSCSVYVFLTTFFTVSIFTMANKPGLVPIDGSYSIMYTSLLVSGKNSSNLLLIADLSKPPECITTSESGISFVLFDLGYLVSGIVQLRLYGDNFNEDSHLDLSDVEIKMADILPLNSFSNFSEFEKMNMKKCGNTGTVSQGTYNVVVDCKFISNARWVLFSKSGKLNLCHIDIFQNTVQPQCFYQLEQNSLFYSKVKSNVEAFKSMRHLILLECLQHCDNEAGCEGIGFVPISSETGICQLLRVKVTVTNLFCGVVCKMFINICHLGQKLKIGSSHQDIVIPLPQIKRRSHVLSVEINGEISCNEINCGETSIYIVDSEGKINSCGKIAPLKYRVFVSEFFFCEEPIKNAAEFILKTEQNKTYPLFNFKSIFLRTADERSFVFNILEYFKERGTTFIPTLLSTQSTSLKTHSKQSNKLIKTNITSRTTTTPTITTTDIAIDSFKYSTFSTTTENLLRKKVELTTTSTTVKSERSLSGNKTYSTTKKQNLFNDKTTKEIQHLVNTTIVQYPSNITDAITLQKSLLKIEKENIQIQNTTSTEPTRNISTSWRDIHKNPAISVYANQGTAPYIWIILVVFLGILIIVTLIVMCVTFLESRKKRKAWDIPPHGIFPLDHTPEQITMQSSLFESTLKQNAS